MYPPDYSKPRNYPLPPDRFSTRAQIMNHSTPRFAPWNAQLVTGRKRPRTADVPSQMDVSARGESWSSDTSKSKDPKLKDVTVSLSTENLLNRDKEITLKFQVPGTGLSPQDVWNFDELERKVSSMGNGRREYKLDMTQVFFVLDLVAKRSSEELAADTVVDLGNRLSHNHYGDHHVVDVHPQKGKINSAGGGVGTENNPMILE